MFFPRHKRDFGIFFAIWPRRVPGGYANGWLHYKWVPGWGWGSSGHWAYDRYVPNDRYARSEPPETWDEEQARLHKTSPDFYATPPHKNLCRNYQLREPGCAIACWYPHCTCMNVGGSKCPE